jgi:ATP adenylyltransferase
LAEIGSFEELIAFLSSKSGLRMSHIYKPVMLLAVIRAGGAATKREIAEQFLRRDTQQIDYYRRKVVHPMPGKRLVRDGLLEKDGDAYKLAGLLSSLTPEQKAEVEAVLEERIASYMTERRNPFGDSNQDAVAGSARYEVLRRAGSRCELCGISSQEVQIDVDHIVPRAKGGNNDLSNLQALCRTCNSQKRDRDDTDFRALHAAYDERVADCLFCGIEQERVVASNALAYAIRDGFPVTEHHTLVIPKRHVADYFELTQAEVNAVNRLLHEQRAALQKLDATVTGFNIGMNCGEDAGQTIFHCHIHLIPRRAGDVESPRGGVRHTVPGKGSY